MKASLCYITMKCLQHHIWVFSALSRFAHSTCFLPNGTNRNAGIGYDRYLPCTPGADGFAMCCALGGTLPADSCLHNGLCQGADNGPIWRESCTDKTWKSPSCIKLCTNSTSSNSTDVVVQNCTSKPNTFCCGNNPGNGEKCCDAGNGLYIVNGTTTASLASSTSTDEHKNHPSKPHTGAIVGGVIGGIVVIALIAFATWYFILAHRKRSQPTRRPEEHAILTKKDRDDDSGGSMRKAELEARTMPGELNSNEVHELQNNVQVGSGWKSAQERLGTVQRSPVELAG